MTGTYSYHCRLQTGNIDPGTFVSEVKGSSSTLKKNAQGDEDTTEYEIGGPSAKSGEKSHTERNIARLDHSDHEYSEGAENGGDDFAGQVRAALEEGCKHLGYKLLQIRKMLESNEHYTKELLDYIKLKTACDDEIKIRFV
jgi:hypothetical protein